VNLSTFDDVEALFRSEEFAALLTAQAANLSRARGKELEPGELERLNDFITEATLVFYGLQRESHAKLYELGRPIEETIKLLTRPANVDGVLAALGSPSPLWLGSDDGRLDNARNRYALLIGDLRKIALAAAEPRTKGKGRPVETRDLQGCARVLAICWEMLYGEPLQQSWTLDEDESERQGRTVRVPQSRKGAAFVRDVIQFLAPDRVGRVPKITEKLVKVRKNAVREVRKTPIKAKKQRRKPRPRK
jgi:hypothetical protein